MKRNIKQIAVWAMALTIVAAFLVLCSEPAPGNEISFTAFALEKLAAFGFLIGSIWGIGKLTTES